MGTLNEIKRRHGLDRWKDVVLVAGAVLLTALAVGSVATKGAQGRTSDGHRWSLTVVESPVEVAR